MAYIGVSPSNGVRRLHTYTATEGQTSFTGAGSEGVSLSYRDTNYLDVFQNGVLLGSADYTATNGTSVVLSQGASVSDLVVIIVYDVFSVADTVSKADGGTFDGNVTMGGTITATGNADFNGDLDVDGTTNLDVVDIDGALTQDGGAVFNEAGADVDFRVESDTDTNALVVDASGNRVGIGVAAPASKLEISAGGNSHGLLRLDETDAANLAGYMQFDSNGTNKANVQNANNAGIHLCVGTGGSVTFTQLGYVSANALDDYEEGTWTATFTGSASNPNSSVTTTGNYIKVGRLVYATFAFANVNTTGATGEIRITGLPFTPSPGNQMTGDVTMHTLMTITADSANVAPFVTSTYIAFYSTKSASAWGGVQNNAGTGGYLYCAISYLM